MREAQSREEREKYRKWEGAKAFRGEDLMLEFYNDVIEQGVMEENGEQGV